MASKEKTVDYTVSNPDVITKYKTAGEISNKVIKVLRSSTLAGSKVFDICKLGDELMEEELSKIYNSKKASKISKGIAFPTCVNPNNIPAHLSPTSEDDEQNLTINEGDVIKIMLGVQVDGFPSIVAETFIIGESKEAQITGKKADLLLSAWKASEAAIRTFQPNKRNWDVTNIVDEVTKAYGCSPVESMLTHNQERNMLYGSKEVILNPTKENKSQLDTVRFEENEVYGLDILVSTSPDGKVKLSNYKTSLYKLTGNSYALKMKSSHQTLGEFKEVSSGPFPINVRKLKDPKKARVGLIECVNHSVILPYDIMVEKENEQIAQFFTTFAITKNGILKFTSPSFDPSLYVSEKDVSPEISELISQPLKTAAKKKKSKKLATENK